MESSLSVFNKFIQFVAGILTIVRELPSVKNKEEVENSLNSAINSLNNAIDPLKKIQKDENFESELTDKLQDQEEVVEMYKAFLQWLDSQPITLSDKDYEKAEEVISSPVVRPHTDK